MSVGSCWRNGAFIRRTAGGLGELTIDNGGGSDAAVSLVSTSTRRPTVTVYVRGRSAFTVTGIRDGGYNFYVAAGTDWDPRARLFTSSCSFERFDDVARFVTTSNQFTTYRITLTPVVDGTATTSEVDPDSFPAP